MKTEQLKLFSDLYTKFNDRCSYICHTLLKDLNNFNFMYKYELDIYSSEVDCYGSDNDWTGEGDEFYDCFPLEFIYKPDEEILQWKNEKLEEQRKEREEKEKIRKQRELDEKYKKYMELKRIFEK